MAKKITNLAASIRQRLLDRAHADGENFQLLLSRFGNERLLYRLGVSAYRDRFVLKGATLFTLWMGKLHRPTRDLDLLGAGSSRIEDVVAVFKEICGIQAEDGIVFDIASIRGSRIREDAEYEGVRVLLDAELAGARIPMQIDVGFGDAEPAREFAVLVHELAHELLHGGERRKELSRKVKETEAEAVAYAVGLSVGLDMNTASADYISLYDGDRDTLRESLESITRVASQILSALTENRAN